MFLPHPLWKFIRIISVLTLDCYFITPTSISFICSFKYLMSVSWELGIVLDSGESKMNQTQCLTHGNSSGERNKHN